jgi:RNA polymerase sigma factor (sigma-70 family)
MSTSDPSNDDRAPSERLAPPASRDGGQSGSASPRPALNAMTTGFVARLRSKDETAWFELWETFGPVLRAQLAKWGQGRIGAETVRDLSQETMAALSDCIDRYDPRRGARFSTWLLAIAKHVLGDEMDRRSAQKRGGGGANRPDNLAPRPVELDEAWMGRASGPAPDEAYEAAMFAAKVHKALRLAEKACAFEDFEVYRMRVIDAKSGKDVAEILGVSEPTVSRRLARVRAELRARLGEVIATYSFTRDEEDEPARNGILMDPNKQDDARFDEAVGEVLRRGGAGGGGGGAGGGGMGGQSGNGIDGSDTGWGTLGRAGR